MTLKEAKAALIEDCKYDRNLRALQWLIAIKEAQDDHEYNTIKDYARMYLGGIKPIEKYTAEEVADSLFVVGYLEDDGTPESEAEMVEGIQEEIDAMLRDYEE